MPDESGRDISIQRIRRLRRARLLFLCQKHLHCSYRNAVAGGNDAVPVRILLFQDFAVLHLLDEIERNTVCLVQENGIFLYQCGCILEAHVDFPRTYRRVPYPEIVHDASVLPLGHLVVDVAAMHLVLLSEMVHRGHERPVVHFLIFQHAVRTHPVIFQSKVERRENVLRGHDMQVILSPFVIGEKRPPICKFRIWGLGIVHRRGVWTI